MNISFYYNSHDEDYKLPFGAVLPMEEIKITVDFKNYQNNKSKAYLIYYKDSTVNELREVKMRPVDRGFSTEIKLPKKGLYYYYFRIETLNECIYFGNSSDLKGGISYPYNEEYNVKPYQITCHEYIKSSPSWYKDAVFYQIFPDRFYNGNENGNLSYKKPNSFIYASWFDRPMYIKDNEGKIARWDFFGGNLKGIEKKLSYIKDLGITGIYLNPIFEARSNHRYDTANYFKIDPVLGTFDDYVSLMKKAKEMGIKIILDGVFNHTGADSIYFNAFSTYDSLGASNSKESPYYSWYNFTNFPKDYECWWGVTDLPNVNENDEGFKDYILNKEEGVVNFWLKNGASGWRLDVADELPDNFIKDIRDTLDHSIEDGVLIGEVWEDASNKIAYGKRREYFLGEELHGVMNYPFKDTIIKYINNEISAHDAYRIFMSLKENYPKEAFYSNLNSLGTHDTKRINTEISGFAKNTLAIALLLTLPGVPCIYYGDEVGVYGNTDPDNRATYPWGKEDNTYLKEYKKLIDLRKSSKAFTEGEFIPFFYNNIFYYFRIFKEEVYLIIINPDDSQKEVLIQNKINSFSFNKVDINLKFDIPKESYLIKKIRFID